MRSPRWAGKGSWHGGQIVVQHACRDEHVLSPVGDALMAVISIPLFGLKWAWATWPSWADASPPCMRKDTAHTISNARILSICSRLPFVGPYMHHAVYIIARPPGRIDPNQGRHLPTEIAARLPSCMRTRGDRGEDDWLGV